jgi:RNA methyltransferase, TrmH family
MKSIIKPYKKDYDYSYTSGAYATIELIRTQPEVLDTVYISSHFNKPDELESLCALYKIDLEYSDIVFQRINQKENSYVLGVFKKYSSIIDPDSPHVVLVNPSDMGNLGTIIRTLAGFDIRNLAVITPAADIWDPKTIRASMGALFRIQFQHFNSISQYIERFPKHHLYPFMLDGGLELKPENIIKQPLYSLVFGNEASGLDDSFKSLGTSIKIPQSKLVDSLNLSIAVAIGTYVFTL